MTKFRTDASIGEKRFPSESLMMSYGYDPQLSEGNLKCPIFQTSTFVFKSAVVREGTGIVQQGGQLFGLDLSPERS